jgi:hypothetical protein
VVSHMVPLHCERGLAMIRLSTFLSLMLLAILEGCVSSNQVSAVRLTSTPIYKPDDRPLVAANNQEAKDSLKAYMAHQSDCDLSSLDRDKPKTLGPTITKVDVVTTTKTNTIGGLGKQGVPQSTTVDKNTTTTTQPATISPAPIDENSGKAVYTKFSATKCVKQIAAYAVDQCVAMANNQNNIAGTTQVLVGIATVSAALATDGLALSDPKGDKTASTALAAAVTSNAAGIPKVVPSSTSVKPVDIITAATVYADAIGLTSIDSSNKASDVSIVYEDGKKEVEAAQLKLARVHDAALSVCPAIPYHRPVKPKHARPAANG